MAMMTQAERLAWQKQAEQSRKAKEAMRATGSKPVAPRTPAGGNLRTGSLTTKTRVR